MKKILIFVLLSSFRLFGIDFTCFDVYQGLFTKAEISDKITTYLEKEPQIGSFYQLTEEAFYIGDLANQKIDFVLHLASVGIPNKKCPSPFQGLNGAKIAIDPGHFGGPFAELEERCVHISAEEAGTPTAIIIEEGTLTYLTALELKSLLEAEGAHVLITRSGIGQGGIEKDFFAWLGENPQLWCSKDPLSKLFRNYYNREDLKARAHKINAFNPDITVIIHYNGHLCDLEKEQNLSITQTNFNLVFVPGAFCAHELDKREERYEFIRLLLSNSMEESLKLSHYLVQQFVTELNVPLVCEDDHASYIDKKCLKQEEGIYARNLALTRLVSSPLCYGETLIQNSQQEMHRLTLQDAEVASLPCPSRIKEVARAYFNGIKEYFYQHQ